MTETEAKTQLTEAGYQNIHVWFDSPEFSYSEHAHQLTTVHVIVSGRMTLTMDKVDHQLGPGDRIDVPAKTVHTAVMGPDGCKYVSGER